MRDAVFVRLAHEHRGERGWVDSSLLAGGNAAGAIGSLPVVGLGVWRWR